MLATIESGLLPMGFRRASLAAVRKRFESGHRSEMPQFSGTGCPWLWPGSGNHTWCRVQFLDRRFHLRRNRIRIGQRQPVGRNRVAHAHLQRLALDVVSIHRQQVKCTNERDWHNFRLRLDRQKKRSRQKRLNLAVPSAPTLGKNYQRHPFAQALQRGLDRSNRSGRVLLIDADLPRPSQMPSNERIRQKLALENDPKLKWQINVENWNIERRSVGDSENASLTVLTRR